MTRLLEGVVPILVTPFDERGGIDEESLAAADRLQHRRRRARARRRARLGDLQVQRGRARCWSRAPWCGTVAGRVPVVINTGAAGHRSRGPVQPRGRGRGRRRADGDPAAFHAGQSAAEIADYYRTIDAAVGIPIVLQDIPQAPVPPATGAAARRGMPQRPLHQGRDAADRGQGCRHGRSRRRAR